MGIDQIDYDEAEIAEKGQLPQDESVDIESAMRDFSNPTEVKSIEEITATFEQNKENPEICLSIPVSITDETKRRDELHLISHYLRDAIVAYFGLLKGSDIDEDIEGILGEATSDVGKHAEIDNNRFDRIFVSARKNSRKLALYLANPAKEEVDLKVIDPGANVDRSVDNPLEHGKSIADGLEQDLRTRGCDPKDKSLIIKDGNQKNVGVLREIEITLPENK